MTHPRQPTDRLVNVFGALAFGVVDRVRDAVAEATALTGETAAALVVIGHAPNLSIDQLARVLRLSHPGAVRLVDRLVSAELATRRIAQHDRRGVALTLTRRGKARRAALLKRRRQTLAAMLDGISQADRNALERIAGALLQSLPTDATSALTNCRFCDDQSCADCPMDVFGQLDERA